jgi:hypothetical protein
MNHARICSSRLGRLSFFRCQRTFSGGSKTKLFLATGEFDFLGLFLYRLEGSKTNVFELP